MAVMVMRMRVHDVVSRDCRSAESIEDLSHLLWGTFWAVEAPPPPKYLEGRPYEEGEGDERIKPREFLGDSIT